VTDGTMAVAGLNPHSGEHGLFGDEEVNHVEPAIKQAQAQGYKIVGTKPCKDNITPFYRSTTIKAILPPKQ